MVPLCVKASPATVLDPSVKVFTIQELATAEVSCWRRNTSFGLIFSLGVLVVNGIIVYQILHSDVSDHLAEYTTTEGSCRSR